MDEAIRFSFWKPEPLPEIPLIAVVNLIPLGKLQNVASAVLDIPKTVLMPSWPWEESVVNIFWEVERGALLRISTESGSICPGQVLTIPVESHVSYRTFYRLYIHVFEQFGTIVLHELSHKFMTPMQYKKHLKS